MIISLNWFKKYANLAMVIFALLALIGAAAFLPVFNGVRFTPCACITLDDGSVACPNCLACHRVKITLLDRISKGEVVSNCVGEEVHRK